MARYRLFKPDTLTDEKVVTVPRDARLLFIGLWPHVDDMGRRQYSPRRIKLELFPADDDVTPKLVDKWMHLLEKAGLLRFYSVDDEWFFWLPHFLRHQKIDRPTHSFTPPHPKDPNPHCLCSGCKLERGEVVSSHNRNGRKTSDVPTGTIRRANSTSKFGESIPTEGREGVSRVSKIEALGKTYTYSDDEDLAPPAQLPNPHDIDSENKAKDRRAAIEALDSLARGVLEVLQVDSNALVLQALTDSIRIKARAEGSSLELSAQRIAGRAALANQQATPEDWALWFTDARYQYLNASDKRLNLRGFVGRAVCGGSLCSDGWETVLVGDHKVSRRCPDCAKLWEEF